MRAAYQYEALMIRVVDGDTYIVDFDFGLRFYHHIAIRLHAFDTSELNSKDPAVVAHARAARDAVRVLLPGGTPLVLRTVKEAAYNRWEAQVFFEQEPGVWVSLADWLQAGGYAKVVV